MVARKGEVELRLLGARNVRRLVVEKALELNEWILKRDDGSDDIRQSAVLHGAGRMLGNAVVDDRAKAADYRRTGIARFTLNGGSQPMEARVQNFGSQPRAARDRSKRKGLATIK